MNNRYSRSYIDASYQVSVYLDKRFLRRRFLRNRTIRKRNCLWRPWLLLDRDVHSLQRTFHKCFLPSFDSFGQAVFQIDIQEYFEMRNWLGMMKFAFRVFSKRPPFSKWLPTKWSNCQWSPISMKIDIQEYFEERNSLVMMKLAPTCPKSDMEGRLGTSVFASIHNQISLLFLIGRNLKLIL